MHKLALRPTIFLPVALTMALVLLAVFSSTALAHEEDHVHPEGPSPMDPVTVPRDWAFTPEGLDNGDTFRLLIVTCGTHDAMDSDIAHYNHFVQDDVRDVGGGLTAYADQFRVLGSTTGVDARDNTYTNPNVFGEGVPIYWANGNWVADHYRDFYDGEWTTTDPGSYADGTAVDFEPDGTVFTGTLTDGTAADRPLGGPRLTSETGTFAQIAIPGHGIGLSDDCYDAAETPSRFYGLSGLFQVEGERVTGG